MKKLIALFLVFSFTSVFADSVEFNVKPFSGNFSLTLKGGDNQDFTVDSVEVSARLQFCNFWGTTCAGGPFEEITTTASYTYTDGLLQLSVLEDLNVSKLMIMNRFSSCNLDVFVKGQSADGTQYTGSKAIIWKNGKEFCNSSDDVNALISEFLKQNVEIIMLKDY